MDGTYKILSAITKPTGYMIFVAGRNGINISDVASKEILETKQGKL